MIAMIRRKRPSVIMKSHSTRRQSKLLQERRNELAVEGKKGPLRNKNKLQMSRKKNRKERQKGILYMYMSQSPHGGWHLLPELLGSLVHPDAPGLDEVKTTGLPCLRGCDLAPSNLDAWLMVIVVLKISMKTRARGRTCCLLIIIVQLPISSELVVLY